ncbi:MAG TPA: PAS domain-containing protein [Methylomirabilota bacterium]|nr:PAS domain-containing protein [Methylomirabilota bacterium]
MAQREVELILTRQLASCLSVPIVLVGPTGDVLFYNEPAEALLGLRFQETGPLKAADAESRIRLTDERGAEIPRHERPSGTALSERRPGHSRMWLTAADGGRREVEVTAFPLLGQSGDLLGAAVMFWERAGA